MIQYIYYKRGFVYVFEVTSSIYHTFRPVRSRRRARRRILWLGLGGTLRARRVFVLSFYAYLQGQSGNAGIAPLARGFFEYERTYKFRRKARKGIKFRQKLRSRNEVFSFCILTK